MTISTPNPTRIAYLDNLKALAIILVVITHTAVTYSSIGDWYYEEHRSLGNSSYCFFLVYQAFTQAFYMSLLFLIAGYFVPHSLENKGKKKFITARLFRLGLPALLFALFISPICIKMIHPNFDLSDYLHGITSFKFLGWTGPLWFTLALLIFSLFYVASKSLCDRLIDKRSFNITTQNVSILILLIALVAFILRLFFPIDSEILNFQLSFFSAYIFMFFLGIFAKQKNIFERIDYKLAKKWLIAAFAIGIPAWILILYTTEGNTRDFTLLKGGWHWDTIGYALWESFFCVSIILGLLGIFKEKFNTQNSLQKFLSTNSFGVYFLHPPILIAISLLLKGLYWHPFAKFVLVAALTLPASFIIAHFIRKIPFIRTLLS